MRSSRTLVLIGNLVVGAVHGIERVATQVAPVAVVAAAVATLPACGPDESQPEYWIKKLDQPAARAPAAKRLGDFYKDAMSRSKENRDDPKVKEILGKIVGPLTKTYVTADLDEKTRIGVLDVLADTRDPGAKDAIIKAIKDFAGGKATADEMKKAALYVKQLKVKEAAPVLIDAFLATKINAEKTGKAYVETQDAMIAIADPSWKPKLIEIISRPLDPKEVDTAKQEVYWQSVSAMVLGELVAVDAFKPLFKILVSPNKSAVAMTAAYAIAKMGKEALPPTIDVLMGKDTELLEFAKKEAGNDPARANWHLNQAASVLQSIGRAEAVAPIIEVLGRKDIADINRVVLAASLANLPAKPESIAAIQKAFETVDAKFTMPNSPDPGRRYIADAASKMIDSSFVPWALGHLDKAKGDENELLRRTLLELVLKVMKKEHIEDVRKRAENKDLADPKIQENFKLTEKLLTECDTKADCYLAKLDDKDTNEAKPFIGVKAAYMVAMNGGNRDELVKRIPKISSAGVKAATMLSLLYLSPGGDPKAVEELQKILDDAVAKKGQVALQENRGLRDVILILKARGS